MDIASGMKRGRSGVDGDGDTGLCRFNMAGNDEE
jgi:hypothetical protein